jgi:hypothetical protein
MQCSYNYIFDVKGRFQEKKDKCTGKNINEKNSLTCMVSECKNETLKKKRT